MPTASSWLTRLLLEGACGREEGGEILLLRCVQHGQQAMRSLNGRTGWNSIRPGNRLAQPSITRPSGWEPPFLHTAHVELDDIVRADVVEGELHGGAGHSISAKHQQGDDSQQP